jgi:hypothetical protein
MHSKGRPGRAGPFASALCAALPGPLAANAVIVTVGGTDYDVLFFPLGQSFDDNEAALMATPWWGDPTLADNIADAYLARIGVAGSPFSDNPAEGTRLWFAYEVATILVADDAVNRAQLHEGFPSIPLGPAVAPAVTGFQSTGSSHSAYAYAAPLGPVTVPEIDGNAMAKALFILFALGVWLDMRRAA